MCRSMISSLLLCVAVGVEEARASDSLRLDFSLPALAKQPDSTADAAAGPPLRIIVERSFARPGDRWVEARLQIQPRRTPLSQTLLRVQLFALGKVQPLAQISQAPQRSEGILLVDLRRHGLREARICVELLEGAESAAVAEALLSARDCENPVTPGQRIPVQLDLPGHLAEVTSWPVTFGVPFPAGALWDTAGLRLVDRQGKEIPSQKEITGRWAPEGAVQWVRFDALVSSADGCAVEAAQPRPGAQPSQPVTAVEKDGRVTLATGEVRYVLSKGISPIEEIWLRGQWVAKAAGTRGLYVVDQAGRTASASADGETLDIEAGGPVAACVRLEGFYRTPEGQPLARHITRVEATAGHPFARVTHTLILSNDTNRVWFKEIGWELAVQPGSQPRAVFAAARADPAKWLIHPLPACGSARMLQDSHFRFGAGKNHCSVAAGPQGKEQILSDGEECGDWAMLCGGQAALMASCREAARQHPKEFEVFPDRIVLRLFSPRAGEELDFRSATLARKWNLADPQAVARLASNAIGWSKTHELLFSPLAPDGAEQAASRLSALHGQPVYASVAPEWIRTSEVMGPLHPQDRDRFPDTEKVIDRLFDSLRPRGHETGHYGFVDYFAGPTYGAGATQSTRYRYTYGLRSSIWMVYARSGSRAVRDFAEGTNKAYMDNWLTHWDGPTTVRGLFFDSVKDDLPFFWGSETRFNISSSTNLNQFLWLYHLTGYRRAKDVVLQLGEGLKRAWKPHLRDWRVLMVFRVLSQCYAFTWDPELRALAEATFDAFVDREGDLLLTKNRPYGSSSYKTGVDVRALLEGWQLFGTPKYHAVATAVARHAWNGVVGKFPITYMNPMGLVGSHAYAQTGDPALVGGLDFGLRRANTHRAGTGASAIAAVFEGLPYAMDVLARTNSDRRNFVSWLAYADYGTAASVLAWKGNEETLDLTVVTPHGTVPGAAGGEFRVQPWGDLGPWGMDLTHVVQRSSGAAAAHVPKDAPQGAYQIVPAHGGEHVVISRSKCPLVLYAPGYWRLPDIRPAKRVYFKLPEKRRRAQLFLEGEARLFDPQGKPFGDRAEVRGWIDLPADKPGLWSFEPLANRLVRARNFPPLFAMGGPEFYFEAQVPWDREESVSPPGKPLPAETRFVPGAVVSPGNQALFLGGQRTFSLEAGEAPSPGGEPKFLPHRQGTVEFFFQPDWDTFDLGADPVRRSFVRMLTDKSSWWLSYRIDPQGSGINMGPREPSHSMLGNFVVANLQRSEVRCWLTETLFERGRWVHIAWVWGLRPAFGPHKEKLQLMTMQIFVNGRGARQVVSYVGSDGCLAEGIPRSLIVGPLQGAIDELRISDVQRYTDDFAAPKRETEWALDPHTRALFHFNGDCRGQSHVVPGPLPGTVKP